MADQLMEEYKTQGLNRLSKEKLVEIISNLQNMPTELAMKVSEHIPQFFSMCSETLKDVKSTYESADEKSYKEAQKTLAILEESKNRWEKCFIEAKTDDKKERYSQKIDEISKRIEDLRQKLEEERVKRHKEYAQAALIILCVAGAAVGVTVNFGKKH